MKTKIIVLLLIFGAVLLSGCTGDEQPSTEENATPEETVTPVENTTVIETPGENLTGVETETSKENVTTGDIGAPEENITSEENKTEETVGKISSPDLKEAPYTVRLINNRANPSSLEIKKGESVAWINMQDNPKRNFSLASEENLFEDTTLMYRRAFAYTFNETGDYHFNVVGQPRMNVTVNVAEP
ncbi:hypothetical protein [Methanosarcina sp. UBA289]|uniref:hypothetical protein n=1 Tax=Methanosarcina sp. UBA289 TaxID=1915574 RepID=UPI0025FCBE4A|nr:hypothetical protein [Methanosarcina sp. UBA289]